MEAFRGGVEVDWVGYWVDYKTFATGLSESGADWIIKWVSSLLTEKSVLVRRFAEGVGRLNFATGALEYL